ncbi:MAG: LPS assembly lipoprotein LptE [Rhodospirillaceae bacterium]|jgi:LPS-assembly lipoprotein
MPKNFGLAPRTISCVLALSILALGLMGCKFRPLYGESAKGDARLLKYVRVDRIDGRIGQRLRTLLRQKFGQTEPPLKPRWSLTITLREEKRGLAVQRDTTTTRRELAVTASFQITKLGRDKPYTYKGDSNSVNSFNELESQYATLSAENDARDRAIRVLSEEIRARVMLVIRHPTLFDKSGKK